MSIEQVEGLIQQGDAAALDQLLRANPSLALQQTSQRISPIMLACYYKKPEIVSTLLRYCPSLTMFEAAATGKFDSLAHAVFEHPEQLHEYSSDGFTALGLAAYFGHEEVTRYLLLKGAEPNQCSNNGYNVYPIHSAVAANQNMIAKMLIEAGADVNVVQQSGITPLHSAAHNGNIELLIVLLEAGANVKTKSETGLLPADMAAQKGFHDIAKILSG